MEQERGEQARRNMTAVGTERERGEQQCREREPFAGRRRRVHNAADSGRQTASGQIALITVGYDWHRPAHRPERALPLLGGAVGQQPLLRSALSTPGTPPADGPFDGERDAPTVMR